MDKAIETHVKIHGDNAKNPKEEASEEERVRNLLMAQVLQKAGELPSYS